MARGQISSVTYRKATMDTKVAMDLGVALRTVKAVTEAFIDEICEGLRTEGVVYVNGLGSFRFIEFKMQKVQLTSLRKNKMMSGVKKTVNVRRSRVWFKQAKRLKQRLRRPT